MDAALLKRVDTDALSIAYLDEGPDSGWPVVLSHGFPYDIHAYDAVTPILLDAGARVIRPFARGFGPTRFLSDRTMRNGQQVARGLDLVQLADALKLVRPIVAGYDWGGNASCVAAALWPERFAALVSYAGYDIIDVENQRQPGPPSLERTLWYQHLFQSERGRDCLMLHRRELGRLLWQEWSPQWAFDDATFGRTADAFDNPDFVSVVIHAYRFNLGREAGDPALQQWEDRLGQRPHISIPAVTIDGTDDPLKPGGTAGHASMFAAQHEHRVTDSGHNIAQERPLAFADAVLLARKWSR